MACVCVVCVCMCVCSSVCAYSGGSSVRGGAQIGQVLGGEETLEISHTHVLATASYDTVQTCGFPNTYAIFFDYLQ